MSDKIEVGDWVVRNRDTKLHSGLEYDVEYKVLRIGSGYILQLEGMLAEDDFSFCTQNFTKVDKPADTSKRRKHYKEIIAWANGAEIEHFSDHSEAWRVIGDPSWVNRIQYRVKPEVNSRKAEIKLELEGLWKEERECTQELDVARDNYHAVHAKIDTLTGEQAGLD